MGPKLSSAKILLIVTSCIVLVIGVMVLFTKDKPNGDSTIFGDIKVKSSESKPKDPSSNYNSIKEEKENPVENRLRYKVKVKKENPFLSLYKEEKKLEQSNVKTGSSKKNSSKQGSIESSADVGFFSVQNKELNQGKRFFKAIFRESQQVQNGKALKIILQEPIPTLNLKSGTILKGIPTFSGDRIMIHITAGVVGKDIFKLDLSCYAQEDYIEGLYHDELAKRLEEATKEGLLDEVLDLDFKGNRIARKANNLTKIYNNINIEKGREVFVAIPEKTEE